MSDPAVPPHVMLISTDHWPANLLGCAGHPTVRTPTLDQLASNGCYFPQAYTVVPACMPARRTLFTGLSPYTHGVFGNEMRRLPRNITTLQQHFRNHGYHAVGVGKIEVFPTRSRAGFDETVVDFEGRGFARGELDDYELYLADEGHPGQRYGGGMCNNDYLFRPWHLAEEHHVINWTARTMCRQLARRDPDKPFFGYLSFSSPHPPLAPLRDYLDLYRDLTPPVPVRGDWSTAPDRSPCLEDSQKRRGNYTDEETLRIRRAFYALCTHIDHQLRTVIGTLSEFRMLPNTILLFTSDHGDMLGDHGLWTKQNCFEGEVRVPMLLSGPGVTPGCVDQRLVSLLDIYPTLATLAGLPLPEHLEGCRMVGDPSRQTLGVLKMKGAGACRMQRDARYKLVYFPAGNQRLLFDLQNDPQECHDLGRDPEHAEALQRLSRVMIESFQLEGEMTWVRNGELVGTTDYERLAGHDFRYRLQRGLHHPTPPRSANYSY